MPKTPKLRKSSSLEKKLRIIRESETSNNSALAKNWGIPRTTIIGILKEKIIQAVEEWSDAKRVGKRRQIKTSNCWIGLGNWEAEMP